MRNLVSVPTKRGGGTIILKSPREIELMRNAGRVVHKILATLQGMVKPGITTRQLNDAAEELIRQAGATSLFKGVVNPNARIPFPAVLCTSVNEQIVHGTPNDRRLEEGDIVSVDCGVRLKGYCGDSATTIPVGEVSRRVKSLLEVTQGALGLAISEMREHRMWSEIAALMQEYVEANGMSVVRDFVGHGIGQEMHEDPKVPNYSDRKVRRNDYELKAGMVLAVEPMVNLGSPATKPGDETGWPIVTRDGQYSAHFEHTIAITPNGVDVLTDGR